MKRTSSWAACAAALSALISPSARAGQYAAMDRVPVEGGELRLQTPARVAGDDGERATAIAFPLKHTHVDVDVAGPMAQIRVEQLFENPFAEPIEAVYLFPLGAEAAVHDYEIVVGDHTIRGQIDTRENARKRYEEARSGGRTAALLEQHKPNVFQQSVANIPPGQPVRVRFTYVELLEPRDGAYELAFPMVVGPRYLPAGTSDPHAVGAHRAGDAPSGAVSVPYLRPGTRSGHDISLHARIDAGVPLKKLESPSHQIVEKRIDDTTVELDLAAGDTVPNRDFVLRYSGAGDATLVGLLTHRADKDGFFTLLVQPKASYQTGDIAPREMVLVIDRSGSMSGRPIEQAKLLARSLLTTLHDRDSFNLVAFADGVESFAPSPVPATEANRGRGAAWLTALECGGGTELGRGVGASLQHKPGQDRVRMVYVLSDGYVGNDDQILGAIQRTLGWNRIFPIGVGSSVNRHLMDRLGQVGRGFTSYLLPADAPDALAATLARRTAYPYLTDVRIDWGGLDVHDVTPQAIPDVYAGIPLVVSGRYRKPGGGEIRVEANAAGQRVVTRLRALFPTESARPAVSYLWARRRVSELDAQQVSGELEEARRAITELGLGFHLVTAYTSFVAIDERRVAGASGQPKLIVQPVEMPDGVSWEGNFGADDPNANANGPTTWAANGGSGGGRWRGGGAVDPFTLLTIASFVPLAYALRRRRRARAEPAR